MSIIPTKDLTIQQGKTFTLVLRWEIAPIKRVAILGITCPNGAARLDVPAHDIPDGWRAVVTNAKGMTEINAADPNRVKDSEYTPVTVIDANTVELNEIDASGFKAYISGGFLRYNTPVVLTGFTGRMSVKAKAGDTAELFSLTSANTRIAIDATARTIKLSISAADTALLAFKTGVYELEMVSADVVPVVTTLLSGKVTVSKEITI